MNHETMNHETTNHLIDQASIAAYEQALLAELAEPRPWQGMSGNAHCMTAQLTGTDCIGLPHPIDTRVAIDLLERAITRLEKVDRAGLTEA